MVECFCCVVVCGGLVGFGDIGLWLFQSIILGCIWIEGLRGESLFFFFKLLTL